MGDDRVAYRGLVGTPEGKLPLARPWCRMDFQKVRRGGMDWIGLAKDRGR